MCRKINQKDDGSVFSGSKFLTRTMEKFLNDIEREKHIGLTDQQLRIAN